MRKWLTGLLVVALMVVGVAGGVACGGGGPAATFEVSNLVINPDEAATGQEVTITATVTNTSEVDGTYTATLKVGGATVDTEQVTLTAEASDTVTFILTEDTAGSYSINVGGESGTLTVTEAVPGELPGTYQYSLEMSDSDGSTMIMDVWVKEGMARTDWTWTDPGYPAETTVFISDGEFDWMYYPDENTAYKWPAESGMNPGEWYGLWFTEYYYGYESESEILESLQYMCSLDPECQGVTLSHGDVDGESCSIFTMTATDGSTMSMWFSTAHGWMLKMEFTEPGGYWDIMQFTGIELNPSIPDSTFDVNQVFVPWPEIIDMTGY